jgi:hypothetical protein
MPNAGVIAACEGIERSEKSATTAGRIMRMLNTSRKIMLTNVRARRVPIFRKQH